MPAITQTSVRDDDIASVISRNHRNQSLSSTTQAGDHREQSSSKGTDYSDYGDYAAYANESVSAYWPQTCEPDPRLSGAALQLPAASEDVLSQREDVQGTQDHRGDYADGVINRNHCNQSQPATTQVSEHDEQSTPTWTDYSDYSYYAHENVSAYWSQTHQPDLPLAGASSQYQLASEDLVTNKEDVHEAQDHQDDYAISAINRNHRNQSDLQYSQATLRAERHKSESVPDTNASSPGKARASPSVQSKRRCPHHTHARWVRFDPSGQAWCDKMNCWDCYRLMKIGEALDYRSLAEYSKGIVKLEHGMEAWSSFVTSQGSFAVLTATQYAIDVCKTLGLESLFEKG
jgi:hypothetical protein